MIYMKFAYTPSPEDVYLRRLLTQLSIKIAESIQLKAAIALTKQTAPNVYTTTYHDVSPFDPTRRHQVRPRWENF